MINIRRSYEMIGHVENGKFIRKKHFTGFIITIYNLFKHTKHIFINFYWKFIVIT